MNTIIKRNIFWVHRVRDIKYVLCGRISSLVGDGVSVVSFKESEASILQILGIHITFEIQFLVDQYYNYDGQDNSIYCKYMKHIFELRIKDQIEERSSQLLRNLNSCEKKA